MPKRFGHTMPQHTLQTLDPTHQSHNQNTREDSVVTRTTRKLKTQDIAGKIFTNVEFSLTLAI